MNLKIRPVTESEYQSEAKKVWDACFPEDGDRFIDYYFANRSKCEYVLAAFDGERMVGDLHILPKKMRLFGKEKDIAFIAGVGTLPQYRMRGIAASLLEAAEPVMLHNGCSAAMLQPFSFAFYEKFGYEPFARHYRCVRPYEPKNRAELALVEASPELLLDTYDRFTLPTIGSFARDIHHFELLLEEARICGDIVAASERGYAWGREDEDHIELYELAGEDAIALADTLAGRYRKPVSCALPCGMYQGEAQPFNMIKVLDETAFFKGLPAPQSFWQQEQYKGHCFGMERY